MCQRMLNMVPTVTMDDSTGSKASLMMTDTQAQSAVTRRILSPTDLVA